MARGPHLTEEEIKNLREMKTQGLSVKEIKERTGRSIATVYKALKEKDEVGTIQPA